MAISLKHPFTSPKADGGDTTLVRPSNWNAEHTLTLAADSLLGRQTAGPGAVEEITCTAAGRALLDDADAAAQRTTLGLGTLATQSGTFSGTSSGTNTGDQLIFQTIVVSGQSNVVADTVSDTLTLAAGTGVAITTNATTDTITIAATNNGTVTSVGGTGTVNGLTLTGTVTSSGNLTLGGTLTVAQSQVTNLVTDLSNKQSLDAELTAIAGLTSAADRLPYFTGSGTAALATFTTAGRNLLDDADAAAQRTTLGVPAAADIVGQQTIWVPAGAMTPRTTNGAAAGTVETATNRVMLKTLDFDTTTQEFVQFAIQMPKGWNESTLICQFIWSHPATTTNFGVVWQIQAIAFADDDAADTAFGSAVNVVDTGGTTNDIYISPETAAVTVAGTPGAEEWVVFQVARAPANGSDTMAVDARLHGVKIHYTTDAAKDD